MNYILTRREEEREMGMNHLDRIRRIRAATAAAEATGRPSIFPSNSVRSTYPDPIPDSMQLRIRTPIPRASRFPPPREPEAEGFSREEALRMRRERDMEPVEEDVARIVNDLGLALMERMHMMYHPVMTDFLEGVLASSPREIARVLFWMRAKPKVMYWVTLMDYYMGVQVEKWEREIKHTWPLQQRDSYYEESRRRPIVEKYEMIVERDRERVEQGQEPLSHTMIGTPEYTTVPEAAKLKVLRGVHVDGPYEREVSPEKRRRRELAERELRDRQMERERMYLPPRRAQPPM
jgi:hypothetical protein